MKTCFCCPSRHTRPAACWSSAGFQELSRRTRRLAPMMFSLRGDFGRNKST